MLRILVPAILLLGLFSVSLQADQTHKVISNKELQKLFSGNTAIGTHVGKNIQIKDYYGKKGHFVSLRSNGKKLVGKWWTSKTRDLICIKYKHLPKKAFCRAIIKTANGGYDKIRGKDGKVLVHYQSIVPGNKTKDK